MRKNKAYKQKRPFRERIAAFMYGRNGADALGNTCFILYFALFIINLFVRSFIISGIQILILAYVFFRMMSKNIYRRQKENRSFCAIGRSVKGRFNLLKSEWRDRKTHVYYKCPHCKKVLRLPKIKGNHTVNCPCCKQKFDIKV